MTPTCHLLLCCRAVVLGYLCTGIICTVLGAFGYALFGQSTASVITVNLPPGSLVALTCTVLTLANPFSAFAVTLEPVAIAAQRKLIPHLDKAWRSSGSGGGGSSNGEARQQEDERSVTGQGSSGDDNQALPYPVRAAVRLGEFISPHVALLLVAAAFLVFGVWHE